MKARFAALATLAMLAGAIWAPAAQTAAPDAREKACNTINLGGPRVFFKENMRCSKAKDLARRVYKSEGDREPRNFDCESGSDFRQGGFCQHVSKPKSFGWHPAD
jgi:hypothetical protein